MILYINNITLQGLFLVLIFFVGLALLCLLFIFIDAYRKKKNKREEVEVKNDYQALLIEYIYEGGGNSLVKIVDAIEQADRSRKKYVRTNFLKEILLLHANIIGEEADRLQGLYLSLNFKDESLKKMKSSNPQQIIQGIAELRQMEVINAYPQITSFLTHTDISIRTEAMLARIQLGKEPFGFLDQLETPLTDWQQMRLHHALQRFHRSQIPDFSQWLTNANETVVVFAIKMINEYDQLIKDQDAVIEKQLIAYLEHPNMELKKAAINTLAKWPSEELAAIFYEQYQHARQKEHQLALLSALQDLASEAYLQRFETTLITNKDIDFDTQLAIAKVIANINGIGKKRLKAIGENRGGHIQSIIQHVLDNRI